MTEDRATDNRCRGSDIAADCQTARHDDGADRAAGATSGSSPVRDAFAANFAEQGEVGAAVCVIRRRRAGGRPRRRLRRPRRHRAVGARHDRRLLLGGEGAGRAVGAAARRRRADRSRRPDRLGLARVRGRRQGARRPSGTRCATAPAVPAIREPLTDDDLWSWTPHDRRRSPRPRPWWVPGTRHSYHTNTYGLLVGEIARRVDGVMPHDALRAGRRAARRRRLVRRPRRRAAALRRPALGPAAGARSTSRGYEGDELMTMLELLQPAGLLVGRRGEHARVAPRRRSRRRTGTAPPRRRADLRRAARARPAALARAARRGDAPAVGGLLPDARRGGHVRARLQADHRARDRSARTPAASGTSAPAARSASPTPTPASPSGT